MSSEPWTRATKAHPCSICGRPDWCGTSPDGSLAVCMRTSEGALRQARNGGWLFKIGESTAPLPAARPIAAVRVSPDWTREVRAAQAATRPDELEGFAATLGVAVESLRLLGAFPSRKWSGALCVPMFDARGRAVGVRIRTADGRKWSAPGGSEGLFMANVVPGASSLLVVEGPTTCAAALDLGAEAIGRPSAKPGALAMAALLALCRGRDVVLVAENDAKPDGRHPGREGAEHCANLLRRVASRCRIVYPPEGSKDLRDALRGGLTREGLRELIEAAPIYEPEAQRQGVTP